MTLTSRLVLYTAHICPFAHRVEAALLQAGAKFEKVEIDLEKKPEWYPQINPASKVPALVIDKDNHQKDISKIPENGVSINESLVLLELVADLYPDAHLLPHGLVNAVNRAKVRLFIEAGGYFNSQYFAWLFRGESSTNILQAIDALQAHLPETGFLLGDNKPTIGDLAFAPFFVRFKDFAENAKEDVCDIAGARSVLETLKTEKYQKFNRYVTDLLDLPSVKSTTPSVSVTYGLAYGNTQAELNQSYSVELEQVNLPLKLTKNSEKVNEFKFWGVNVYDKRSSMDPFDTNNPSMPRGWGTNHANASYHKNSEPLIIGISVVLASVIVFTMFGTIVWRRRRKSKSRTKLKKSESGFDGDQDEPKSTTSFIRKRRNPLKYLKHRKGRKIHHVPSLRSIISPSINNNNDNDNEEERGELLSHDTGRNRASEGDDDNSRGLGGVEQAEQVNQETLTQIQPRQRNDDNENEHHEHHEHHESPPPFPLDRDTDSGALPALPPAYRPNSQRPTTSRRAPSTTRQTEKSRYINSRGNNDLEELEETPEPATSDSDSENDNSAHHLTAHIAIDDKDHLRNLHMASSSPFGDDEQRRHDASVPVANVDGDGYETVEEGFWKQPDHDNSDTKKKDLMPSLPLPPTAFEPTFSPFDLPYSDESNNDHIIPPAPSAPPPSHNTRTIEASAPPLETDDGHSQ
ncbi:hypothetical protein E3P78_01059 [Wallemia ichthyophaga]|nr:hypothetical protein E3P98_01132 [Wallemia ichthyophaga]TIB64576.1 hypothetical protein E3P78_01059 [Wallemia ichthyophaga]